MTQRNRLARLAQALCLVACSLGTGGCILTALAVGAAAAYGAIEYTENEAYRDFHRNLDKTWSATIAALNECGYPVADTAPHAATEGRIEIGDARIRVEQMPGDPTTVRVHVRIGAFNNEEHRRKAGLILERAASRLD